MQGFSYIVTENLRPLLCRRIEFSHVIAQYAMFVELHSQLLVSPIKSLPVADYEQPLSDRDCDVFGKNARMLLPAFEMIMIKE